MFRYFPANHVWNLSVDLVIEMGARIGETEAMCAPLVEASKHPDAAGTKAFRETWVKMADPLCELAAEDEARGRLLSAGAKYKRAASHLITTERLQAHDAPGRLDLYKRELQLFHLDSTGAPLPSRKDAYLNRDGSRIVCAAHGAQFEIESGLCVLGPCLGESLQALSHRVDADGSVWLTE